MIRLSLLGGAALVGPDGPVRGRAAQRRRLAFLAILAARRGDGVSRDRVVGLLWPDHDEDRARRLLSEALYVVRKELGEAVVESPGDDLRLNPDELPSDLGDFLRALDAGDRESAVGAYGGPFLDGFFIDDAPEFEKWVDGERDALARAYGKALRELAERANSAGDVQAAARWWRRLAAHDRYDASIALGLMRALEAAGNRADAIRHAQVHAALLREELEAEPDPEVEAYGLRLRDEPQAVGLAPAAEDVPDPAVGARAREEAAPEPAVPAAAPAVPEPDAAPPRSRRPLLALGAVAAVLLAALALWLWLGGRGEPPTPNPAGAGAATVIPPFQVPRGSEDAALLAEGVATLLAAALDGAGGLAVVSPRAVLSLAARRPGLSPAQVAKRFEAPLRVEGTVVEAAGRLRVEARLLDARTNAAGASATGEAPRDSLFALVDDIATQILAERGADPLTRVAARTTSSLEAFKAYQRGSEAFRATSYEAAVEAFMEAVDLDPSFALAHYRLSAASEWAFDFQRARVAIRSAQRSAERLPGRERALVNAWAAFLEGDADRAERLYEALVAQTPHDPEAWAGLGEVLVHFNPVRGRPVAEAEEPLRRAIDLDPGVGEARFHLLEFAAAAERRSAFDSLYAGVDATSDQAIAWRAVRAAAWGDETERTSVRAALRAADPIVYGVALGRIAANLGDLEAASALGAMDDPPLDTPELAAAGHILRASVEAARGRPDAARGLLGRARDAEPDWAREFAALFALLPGWPTDSAELASVRADLEAWDPGTRSPNIGFFLGAHADAHRHLRHYLLGLLDARLGQFSSARERALALERLGRSDEIRALGRALAESLRAHAAAAEGDPDAALRHLDAGTLKASIERVMISPFFARSPDRWLRAELAEAAGDTEEALRWLRSLGEGYEFLYAAPAHLRVAELLDREGRSGEALDHYRRFLELWADAEPAALAEVAEVRSRLARLGDAP